MTIPKDNPGYLAYLDRQKEMVREKVFELLAISLVQRTELEKPDSPKRTADVDSLTSYLAAKVAEMGTAPYPGNPHVTMAAAVLGFTVHLLASEVVQRFGSVTAVIQALEAGKGIFGDDGAELPPLVTTED